MPLAFASFSKVSMATSNILIAFTGHLAYLNVISEMARPRDFPKALALVQVVTTTFYLIVAVVIYQFAGQDVLSPALGSAPPLFRRIVYGLAVPTIIVAGVICALVAAKNLVKLYGQWMKHVTVDNCKPRWPLWLTAIGCIWSVAFFLAILIPEFSNLLALIGAMFGTWIALGFCSILWFHMHREQLRSRWSGQNTVKLATFACVNFAILVITIFLVGLSLFLYVDNPADDFPVAVWHI